MTKRLMVKRVMFILAGCLLVGGIHMVEYQHGLDAELPDRTQTHYGPGY